MNTSVRLGVGVLALGTVFAAAVGVGLAVGPVDAPGTHAATGAGHAPAAAHAHGHGFINRLAPAGPGPLDTGHPGAKAREGTAAAW